MSANGLDRREALQLIALGAAAAMSGCQRPAEVIVPYVDQPEGLVPGRARRYATALPLAGYGRGVTGLVVDGRPTKLEGLAAHPASLGATDVFVEGAILDLYDPQRLKAPVGPDEVASWSALASALQQRLAGSDGRDLRVLTGRITSPTLLARMDRLKQLYPAMRHVRFEPIGDDAALAGATLAFGRPLVARPRFADADVILALDADPLGPGPDQIANGKAWSRRKRHGSPPRLYVLEPSLTLTGASADRRAALHPAAVADAALHLARALGADAPAPALPPAAARLIAAAARDLVAAKGRALVLAGRGQAPELHAFAAWANAQLGAPVDWIAPVDPDPTPHAASLAELARELHGGKVGTLLVIGCNPVHATPPSLGFGEALRRVPLSIAADLFETETSARCRWRVPLSHPLESWGDLSGPDGTASIVQPLIRPLYGSRSASELLDLLDPTGGRQNDHDRVRAQWASAAGGDFERWWTDTLVRGVIPNSAAAQVQPGAPRLVLPRPSTAAIAGLTLTIAPSPTLWDGSRATNAWLQECPEPFSKEVWGSSLRLARADMMRLKLEDGDRVRIGRGAQAVELPARTAAGQAPGVATMLAGYGRTASGPIADGIGANAFRLRRSAGEWIVTGLQLEPTGERGAPPSTQHQFQLNGDLAKLYPILAPGEAMQPLPEPPTLLPPTPPPPPGAARNAWAMVIDTSVCIGCNACVIACQSENNVPAIGAEQIAANRDMHWLRVDTYDRGGEDEPRPGFQPVPCMHCEKAPCEPVCPVEASVHDRQGLNVQVYNRCIGTRTCQANCPYKVRRFNFLDYADANLWGELDPRSIEAQRNPDVTVRSRGVMEKCTYCVQRISAARHDADAAGTAIPTDIVVTACAAACPTDAIVFGDLADPASKIHALRRDPRHYALLGELGTRPRTTYLAKTVDAGDEG